MGSFGSVQEEGMRKVRNLKTGDVDMVDAGLAGRCIIRL
jgi:hypothetical protein